MAARGSRALQGAVAASRSESEGTHSGRLLLRMPQSLHSALARAAEREGVSLNQFIASTLADAVGQGSDSAPRQGERVRSRPSGLALALLVNAVVVVVAALVAVAMLVLAWLD
jgi:HicB family